MIISTILNSVSITKGFRIIKSIWGKKNTVTSNLSVPYGFDCNPPQYERAIVADTGNNAESVVVGFVSKNVIDDLVLGESGLYAKDPDGNVVATIKLRNDGTIEMSNQGTGGQSIGDENTDVSIGGTGDNLSRYSVLETAFNELQEKFNDLVASFNSHVHATAAVGPPSPPTPSPTVPASISEENIEGAKIENVFTNTGQ